MSLYHYLMCPISSRFCAYLFLLSAAVKSHCSNPTSQPGVYGNTPSPLPCLPGISQLRFACVVRCRALVRAVHTVPVAYDAHIRHQPENPMSASSGILISYLYLPLRAHYYHTSDTCSDTCLPLPSLSSFTITHS